MAAVARDRAGASWSDPSWKSSQILMDEDEDEDDDDDDEQSADCWQDGGLLSADGSSREAKKEGVSGGSRIRVEGLRLRQGL